MSYTYPEALNAMEKIAMDLCQAAFPDTMFNIRVVADTVTGTASVDWSCKPTSGRHCYITINMPVRKATYRMTSEEFRHWAAYLLHEVGHPFETDKVEWASAVSAGRHKLLNSLEDVREELCTIRRGIAKNAVRVFSDLIDMLHAKAVASGYEPNRVESIGWTISALGRRANGYAIDISDIDAKLDPNGVVGKIVPWALADLAACASTADCRALADKIIAAVNAERQIARDLLDGLEEVELPQEPEPQGGQSETRGKEEEPEPEEEAQDTSPVIPLDGASEPDGPAQEAEAEEESPEGDGARQGSGEDAEAPEEEAEEAEEKAHEFTDDDVEEVDMKPTTEGNMTSSSRDAQAQKRVVDMLRRQAKSHRLPVPITGRDTHGSVAYVTGKAAKMGRQRALLARALKASDNDDFDGGRTHGRINRRALGKLATGANTIFGKRTMTEGYDTDVQILVDGSGSMAQSIEAAASLALVIAQAASQVGVDCTAHLFNDSGLHEATKGKGKPVGRKFAYMRNNVMGGTPLSENLLLAAQTQHKRSGNKRRVLFLITDGGCNSGADVLKAAGLYVESLGCEIANLHIDGEPMGVFRNECAVNVRNVAETGLKQLTAVLERGAQ